MERLIRTFVAIRLPPEVAMAVADRLRGVPLPGSVVDPPDWHVTLRYLGDLDQVAVDRLTAALDEGVQPGPFSLRLGGLDAFPHPRRTTVLWLAVLDPSGSLGALQAEVEEACAEAGLGYEERPFLPHLTVSRVRPPRDVRRLVASMPPLDIVFRVDGLVLFESRPAGEDVRYRPLESFPL